MPNIQMQSSQSESKQMMIPPSERRLVHSLYRFVFSRTSGAEYICPLSSRTARLTNAGRQAVTSHRPSSKSWWGSRVKARNGNHGQGGGPGRGLWRDDGERAPPGGSADSEARAAAISEREDGEGRPESDGVTVIPA